MAVKIVQKKVAAAASGLHEAVEDGLKELIDPLGHAKVQMDVANTKFKTLSKVYLEKQKEFLAMYGEEAHKPTDVAVKTGESFIATISAEGKARKVTDPVKVFGMLEEIAPDLAMKLMAFKLGDLDKYLTPEQLEEVLETDFTGKRTLKLQALG